MINIQYIVLGGGCFWCLEAVFQRVQGVLTVTNGYSGGNTQSPSYESVSMGRTGHAEVVKVEFNSDVITLETLLQIFWAIHDPTTLNRQGADVGSDYRSIILFNNDDQQKICEDSKNNVATTLWKNKVVTEIVPLEVFWPAEDYHQNYFNSHPERAYCQIVINPKVAKLKQKFSHLLAN